MKEKSEYRIREKYVTGRDKTKKRKMIDLNKNKTLKKNTKKEREKRKELMKIGRKERKKKTM